MLRSLEDQLKVSLVKKIGEWWGEIPGHSDLPYVCADIEEIMAAAALAVLRGIADTQDYVLSEGYLVEPTDD